MSDNSDGITTIDVTDPDSPAYCFVFLYDLFDDDWDTPIMTQSPDGVAADLGL